MNEFFSAKAIKAAVIGDPIDHSLSPKIHNFLLRKHGIDGVYIALRIAKADLIQSVSALVKMGFAGFNVTMPYKEEIFKICDFTSNSAKLTKAVNTVIITSNKRLFGHNSDVAGFLNNLRNSQPSFDLKNKNAFVIGAGGAARAVVYGLVKSSVKKIYITNRSKNRALELIKNFAEFAKQNGCRLEFFEVKDFVKNLEDCDLLVNTAALGMVGCEDSAIDLKNLKKSAIVYDIVYNPLITEILKLAQEQGNQTVTGLGMLIEQALIGFEAWFKTKPLVDSVNLRKILGFF